MCLRGNLRPGCPGDRSHSRGHPAQARAGEEGAGGRTEEETPARLDPSCLLSAALCCYLCDCSVPTVLSGRVTRLRQPPPSLWTDPDLAPEPGSASLLVISLAGGEAQSLTISSLRKDLCSQETDTGMLSSFKTFKASTYSHHHDKTEIF